MCEICNKSECSSGCPNSENPVLSECDNCGKDLYEGDKYYQIYIKGINVNFCEECIDDCEKIVKP